MQSSENLLETELSRILSSNASVQLTKQLKSFNSYEKKIEEEIMTKSAQIMQLQNFLKNEIENIQNIVQENNQLKIDLEARNKELSTQKVLESELHREIETLTEMNRASNFIIKRLEEHNQQLIAQMKAISQSNKKVEPQLTQTQTFNVKVHFKIDNSSETAMNTEESLLSETTFGCITQSQKLTNLQAKIKQLEATVLSLKFQKSQLLLKLQCYQSTSNQSVSQCQAQQSIVQQRKTTSQILQIICNQSLIQLKFKGQLVNGSKEGKGVCEYEENLIYEGYFKNNKRHGLGSLYYHEQLIYRGYWTKGLMEGKGLLKMLQGQIQSYEGQFIEGELEGYGLMKLKSGKKILGFWKGGKIEGSCLEQNQKCRRLSKPQMIQCY